MEDLVDMPQASFWRGKRVLLTGHSGFKGSWLAIWLHRLGAEVVGLSLHPNTEPNLFTLARVQGICQSHFCDIRHASELAELVQAANPQIVFHLAAQPLVRASYRDPLYTYQTNIMGTAHLLQAMHGLEAVKVAVMVTTDKVYHNTEQGRPYREGDLLGGRDPYSASKAASEMVIGSYREAYLAEQGVAVASVRAGNVIGGGDWSEDRLIPDAIRSWQSGQVLEIRCPDAVRPWQHVLDPLAGYLTLAERLWENPTLMGAYNFGPESDDVASVKDVIELARRSFDSSRVRYESSNKGPPEAGLLTLDIERSRTTLGVVPRWPLPIAVKNALEWYRAQQGGANAWDLCSVDIAEFERKL